MSREQIETAEIVTRAGAVETAPFRAAARDALLGYYAALETDGAQPPINAPESASAMKQSREFKMGKQRDWLMRDDGWIPKEMVLTEEEELFGRFVVGTVGLLPHVSADLMSHVETTANTPFKNHRFETADPEEAQNILSNVIWIGAAADRFGRNGPDIAETIKTPFYVVGVNKHEVLLVPAAVDIRSGVDDAQQTDKYNIGMNGIHVYSRGKRGDIRGFAAMQPLDSVSKPEELTAAMVQHTKNPKTGRYIITAQTPGANAEEFKYPFGLGLPDEYLRGIDAVGLAEHQMFDCLRSLAERFHEDIEYADALHELSSMLPDYPAGTGPDSAVLAQLANGMVRAEMARHDSRKSA